MNKDTKLDYRTIFKDILNNPGLSPEKLSEYLVYLAGEYSYFTDQFTQLLIEKPAVWNELRKDLKSDKATDRAYDATEKGMQEVKLRLRLKALEKLMSALKTKIKVAENESYNHY